MGFGNPRFETFCVGKYLSCFGFHGVPIAGEAKQIAASHLHISGHASAVTVDNDIRPWKQLFSPSSSGGSGRVPPDAFSAAMDIQVREDIDDGAKLLTCSYQISKIFRFAESLMVSIGEYANMRRPGKAVSHGVLSSTSFFSSLSICVQGRSVWVVCRNTDVPASFRVY